MPIEVVKNGENLLEVDDLKTYFYMKDATVKAVDGVSFSLSSGETFGLVGESGSGKSQTLRSILRLISPPGKIVSGSIRYKGQDLLKVPAGDMRKYRGSEIGMIFQEPMTALNPVIRIREQIFESLENKNMTTAQKNARAVELLRLVGVPSPERRIDEYAHQFSGGMRQRAMIAITLAAEPKILLADEPTTALDVTIQDQILQLIMGLKDRLGMSVILVTHDLGIVAQMCDRVAVMYAGRIVEITDTLTLFGAPRHPYTLGLMSSLPHGERGARLQPITGQPPNLSHLPAGCPFEPRCSYAEPLCTQKAPEMVEVGPGHLSRCHFVDKLEGQPGIINLAETAEGRR